MRCIPQDPANCHIKALAPHRISQPLNSMPPRQFFFEFTCSTSNSHKLQRRPSSERIVSHQEKQAPHPTAQFPLPFSTPHRNNDPKQQPSIAILHHFSLASICLWHPSLSTVPTPKSRGGVSFLASVQGGFTPTDLLARARNRSHQKSSNSMH